MSLSQNFRLRPDLIVQTQEGSLGTWIVKDPISLRFFLFGSDEHFILQRLNGEHSAEAIIRDFGRERAPKQMTAARLQAFLAALYRNGLASTDAPEQSALLRERERDQRWRESVQSWTSLLAIRLPGVNPDLALDRLYGVVRGFISWWSAAILGMICCLAIGTTIVQWQAISAQLPRMEEFVSGRNLMWLGLALVGTKCLHELAHALVCKHFGGRCHEMGILLLFFTPCLYCNVTDAWMLKSRWQRIAISSAGMVMELILASLAVLCWRYSEPGAFHSICLNVMLICGVSTLVFNGNPLLKYDGYYILSDLVGIPNLWQDSRAYFYAAIDRGLFGSSVSQASPPKHRLFLWCYALASICYRVFLTASILIFIYRLMHPRGFELLFLAVVASFAIQSAISWIPSFSRWWRNPLKWKRIRKSAVGVVAIAMIGTGVAICFIPFPYGVIAPAVVQPTNAARVFVTTPGTLANAIEVGEQVTKGQLMAELVNVELNNRRLGVASDLARAQTRVKTLQARLNDETAAASQLMVAQEIMQDLYEQLRLLDEDFKSLTLSAPVEGTVIAAPAVARPRDSDHELPAWSGTPLDRENQGCYLERGDLLCILGNPNEGDAIVLVDETEVGFVRLGQQALLRLENARDEILNGNVVEIAEVNAETAPVELIAQHDVTVRNDGAKDPKLVRTMYQVRIALKPKEMPLLIGARATAKILVDPQTLSARLVHWFQRTIAVDPHS